MELTISSSWLKAELNPITKYRIVLTFKKPRELAKEEDECTVYLTEKQAELLVNLLRGLLTLREIEREVFEG